MTSRKTQKTELPQRLPDGETFRGQLSATRPDGSTIQVVVYASPVVPTANAFVGAAAIEDESWFQAAYTADPEGLAALFASRGLVLDDDESDRD